MRVDKISGKLDENKWSETINATDPACDGTFLLWEVLPTANQWNHIIDTAPNRVEYAIGPDKSPNIGRECGGEDSEK